MRGGCIRRHPAATSPPPVCFQGSRTTQKIRRVEEHKVQPYGWKKTSKLAFAALADDTPSPPSPSKTRGCIRRRLAAAQPPTPPHAHKCVERFIRRRPATTPLTPTLLALTNAWGVYTTTPGRRATPDTPSRSQLRGGFIRRRPAATPPPPRQHPSRSQMRGGCIRRRLAAAQLPTPPRACKRGIRRRPAAAQPPTPPREGQEEVCCLGWCVAAAAACVPG
ncbi:hypothetical protein BC826DRAFT_610427 [Russula brevipes]|nr:hypothetical protein BC826DRAFT_610427 [Russula brevipes]